MPQIEFTPQLFQFPLGSRIEIEVATTPYAAQLMHDDTVDPFELAESFTGSLEAVGAVATFPQVALNVGNAPGSVQPWCAKVAGLIVSSNVSGVVTVTPLTATALVPVNTNVPRRQPTRAVGYSSLQRWGLIAPAPVGAYPGGPYIARFHVSANIPFPLALGHELLHPSPPGVGTGDGILVTGPTGTATIEVTFDWKEQLVDP